MCDVKTENKYRSRPSPPRPANDPACRGKTFTGNDGKKWTSIVTSSGVYRWVKTGTKTVSRKSPPKSSRVSLRKSPAKKSPSKKSPIKKKTFTVTIQVLKFENLTAEKSLYLCSKYLTSVKKAVKSQLEAMALRDEKIKATTITCENRILKVKVTDMKGNYEPNRLLGNYIETDRTVNGVHWSLYAKCVAVSK